MKYFAIAVIYAAFFALVGFAVWWTDSAWALLALLFAPRFKFRRVSTP